MIMSNFIASDLPRIMQCNGSILIEHDKIVSVNTDMTVKDEGDAVHYMIDAGLRKEFAPIELVDRKAPNGVFITDEMAYFVDWYFENLPSLTDFHHEIDTSWQVDGNTGIAGRADYIYHDTVANVLHVSDFKYGWRIIEPKDNWTLISHAIGFCALHGIMPERVVFTIYQPRPYHPLGIIRSHTVTGSELNELKLDLQQTLTNLGVLLSTGPTCLTCPSIATCPAATVAAMNAIDVSETAFNDEIENNALSYVLDQLDYAEKILNAKKKAFNELAMFRLKKGELIPNRSLVNTMSNRQWKKETTPEIILALTGVDATKKALITPTQALKSGMNETIVDLYSERVSTGFKLEKIDANVRAHQIFNIERN